MTKKSYYPQANQNIDFAVLENEILKFWQEEKIFEKSVEIRNFSKDLDEDNTSPVIDKCALKDHANCRHQKEEKSEFVFYDGPPFANGLPHYGHLLTGFIKDIFARYQTMKGKKVERRFGWDTHGLPVEMETEKELTAREGKQISGQIAIQEYGIEKFNDACRTSVMKYAETWENYVTRQGRFVDFKNSYKTMDLNYMESVIWAFKELFDKGLLYEDFRVVPYSWACQTPLSNFETRMDNSYRQKASKAVTVKFELIDIRHSDEWHKEDNFQNLVGKKWNLKAWSGGSKPIDETLRNKLGIFDDSKINLVAWTTTPWTLPSNLALAVGKDIEYAVLKKHCPPCHVERSETSQEIGSELVSQDSSASPQNDKTLGASPQNDKTLGASPQNDKTLGASPQNDKTLGASPQNDKTLGASPQNDNYEYLILAAGLVEKFAKDLGEFEKVTTIKGSELIGYEYKPLFPYFVDRKKDYPLIERVIERAFRVLHGDFVSTDEGTGIVHMAPGFGEDDQLLCKANGIPTLCPVDEGGKFTSEIFDLGLAPSPLMEENSVVAPSPLRGEGRGEGVNKPNLTNLAKDLRKNQTDSESKLWNLLRNKQLENFKFRRQQQIGNYIVDFVCLEKNLIIELDGGQHGEENNQTKDQIRTNFLEKEGFRVLRFWNNEVLENIDGVGETIYSELSNIGHPHPTLSPQGRGLISLSLKGRQVFETNDDIIKYLKKATNAWLKTEQYLHNYPHCWRTDTPLIYKAVSSWYVKVTDFKDRMVELNQGINWIPNHIKDGQFGKWLEGARDWSISRNRFWGCPVPVWKSESGKVRVFGSIAELEKISGKKINNLHRPFIDEVTFVENGETYKRVSDVLDCWFESGSMPYAQVHYPFENKEWFEENFPADFITEYVAQTRGWFYTLTVLSTALFDKIPFKNVICHGTILDENSQKLSKRLRNYADPLEIFSTFGSDAMRFYMISQPVMRGQELKIDKDGKAIRDTLRLSIKPLINAFNFFCLYANSDGIKASRIEIDKKFDNVLDRYILAKLKTSVEKIDLAMSNYDTVVACEEFNQFFEALNNWYIRRNRQRFWRSVADGVVDQDKQNAYDVLYTVLLTMCEASSPLLPFTTEFVWKSLVD